MDSVVYFDTISEVLDSWERVKSVENYRELVGVALFDRMFELAPEKCDVFPWKKEDFERKDPKFLAFAKKFVRMLDIAIDMLGPDMDIVEEQMYDLGVSHQKYGVLPHHFDVMGQALEHTLQGILGSKFTPATKNAWRKVYGFMTSNMIHGAAPV